METSKVTNLYFLCVDIQVLMIDELEKLEDADCGYSLVIDAVKKLLSDCSLCREECFRILYTENQHRINGVIEDSNLDEFLSQPLSCLKEDNYMIDYTLHLTKEKYNYLDPPQSLVYAIRKINSDIDKLITKDN